MDENAQSAPARPWITPDAHEDVLLAVGRYLLEVRDGKHTLDEPLQWFWPAARYLAGEADISQQAVLSLRAYLRRYG